MTCDVQASDMSIKEERKIHYASDLRDEK